MGRPDTRLGLVVGSGSRWRAASPAWPGPKPTASSLTSTRSRAPAIIGVDVKYRYTSGGRTYTGDRYRFQFILLNGHMESRDVDLAIGRYPVGEQVQVAVNPRDPARLGAGAGTGPGKPAAAGRRTADVPVRAGRSAPKREGAAGGLTGARRSTVPDGQDTGRDRRRLFLWGARSFTRDGAACDGLPPRDGSSTRMRARETNTRRCSGTNTTSRTRAIWRASIGPAATAHRSAMSPCRRRSDIPLGGRCKVYYNPRNPAEALLEPGVWYGNFVTLGIAAAHSGRRVAG